MSISFPVTPGIPPQFQASGAASAPPFAPLAQNVTGAAGTTGPSGLGSGLQSLAAQMQGYLVQMQGTGTRTVSAVTGSTITGSTGASAGQAAPAAERPHHRHHQDDSRAPAGTGLADSGSAQPGSPLTASSTSTGGALASDMAKALQAYAALAPASSAAIVAARG